MIVIKIIGCVVALLVVAGILIACFGTDYGK